MKATIYYNPACGTARNTLAALREAGIEPEIIEYLKNPPSRAELISLLKRMGMSARDLMRTRGTPAAELGLDQPGVSEDAILDAMLAHPVLIERPIVVTEKGVRLCRPKERLQEIL